MKSMPIRSRLSVDASPELITQLNLLAAKLSAKENKKVSQREVILRALASFAMSHDEIYLTKLVSDELSLDPDILSETLAEAINRIYERERRPNS